MFITFLVIITVCFILEFILQLEKKEMMKGKKRKRTEIVPGAFGSVTKCEVCENTSFTMSYCTGNKIEVDYMTISRCNNYTEKTHLHLKCEQCSAVYTTKTAAPANQNITI